jgi:hypothetical protein
VSPARYELRFYIPKDGILHSHGRENLKEVHFFLEISNCGKQKPEDGT